MFRRFGPLALILLLTTAAFAGWPSSGKRGSGGGGGGYAGPGDIVSGATAYWSLYHCYNTAYGGNVADVYAPADASHTLITCTAGGTINETLQSLATTCASSCTVKEFYDQTGNSNHLIQATSGLRFTVTLSCLTALPCAVGLGSSSQCYTSAGTATETQPCVVVAMRSVSGRRRIHT